MCMCALQICLYVCHFHVFVFISLSLQACYGRREAGADSLPRGGRVCEGERQGSQAVLLCFTITALSDLRMLTDLSGSGALLGVD